jgi:hypothetical protein
LKEIEIKSLNFFFNFFLFFLFFSFFFLFFSFFFFFFNFFFVEAGVVKTKSPPVAIPFGILDAMEEDSMGKTVSADDVCLPDDDQELLSVVKTC